MARPRKANQSNRKKSSRAKKTSAAKSAPANLVKAESPSVVEANHFELVSENVETKDVVKEAASLRDSVDASVQVQQARSDALMTGQTEEIEITLRASDFSALAHEVDDAPVSEPSRTPASLPTGTTTVLVIESHIESWDEPVELYAISRFGASFSVSQDCQIGRLITLYVPASVELPAFKQTTDPMPVICLVQQCNEFVRKGKPAFHIGVVFVGTKFPQSFDRDPKQCYRVAGTDDDGLFLIKETETPHKTRRHPRFRMKFDVKLLLIQKSDRSIVHADGVTNDVGVAGISVVSPLDAHIGDKIKVGCREIDFDGVAVIRNRRLLFGSEYLLHLEFVEARFPIERVLLVPEGVLEGFERKKLETVST